MSLRLLAPGHSAFEGGAVRTFGNGGSQPSGKASMKSAIRFRSA
jgi:hypothetical protein